MTELVVGAIATGAGALACGIALGRTLLRYRTGAAVQSDADSSPVTLSRYSVLTRLTSEEDEQFLRELPRYKPEMLSRLRRERRVILRMYLRELAADFQSLHQAARRIVAEAPEEHADLVGVLVRQQVTFWRYLTAIEVRLALAPLGLPKLDAGRLLDVVEALRAEVARSTASPEMA